MRQLLQFIMAFGPDVWYGFCVLLKFFRNLVFWLLILMLGGMVATWIIPHSFARNPSWLGVFILTPLCDLLWILYMTVSLFWVFKPKITETDAFMLRVFYGAFESIFNFRSLGNFLRGVLIMAVFLLSAQWMSHYFIGPSEVEPMPEGFDKWIEKLN